MRYLSILILFSCAKTVSYSQGNYTPGFYVDNGGDTIRGLIEYQRWDANPSTILFKKSGFSGAEELNPTVIKSFFVAGERYESATVDVDTSPYKLDKLDSSPLPKNIRATVFLQSLIEGNKRLLLLKDQHLRNHFYIPEGQEYEALVYKQYLSDPVEMLMAVNEGYKKRLALYFKDCSTIQSSIGKTAYTVNSLLKLFHEYYQCASEDVKYVNERKDARAELGIVAGASASTISFSEKFSYDYLYKANYSGSVRPTVGFYCDFMLLRALGMKLGNDLLYSSFSVKGSGITGMSGSTTQTTDATFNYHYFKTHHMVQINLMRNGSLYVAGGCSLGFVLDNEDDVNVVYNMASISKREFISKPFEIGYVIGIGTRYEKWSLELKYEKSSGITDYPPGKTMRFHMLLRCRLFG